MGQDLTFIVIDDNVIDILIYKLLLKSAFANANIIYFTDANDGLLYIRDNYPASSGNEAILLLDINMPGMNGWEFLKEFEKLKTDTKKQIRIFLVSFFVNNENGKLAYSDPNVELIVSKPLTREKILALFKPSGTQSRMPA